jgi:TRAP-type C4-dicarboxylate transport system permease small subunit
MKQSRARAGADVGRGLAVRIVAGVLGLVARAALWLAGAGLVLMTAVVAAQVFFRYVLNDSIVWSEPLAVILMGWFIFLGAAVGIRDGYHLSFEILLHVLPPGGKVVLNSLSDVVVGVFGCGMVWFGSQLMLSAWSVKLPSLGMTGAIDFMPLVAGGVLVVLFSLERLARRAAGLPTARFGDSHAGEA